MGIVGDIKDVAKMVQQIGNMDLYRKILDLQGEALELTQQLQEKDKKIVEIEAALRVRAQMIFNESDGFGEYRLKDGDGKLTAERFCQKCYDVDGTACHLQQGVYVAVNGRPTGPAPFYVCQSCKTKYTVLH